VLILAMLFGAFQPPGPAPGASATVFPWGREPVVALTHAGANTVLESLSAGVPMIAIPIGFEQPGMAARVAYQGVGEFIEEEQPRLMH
jgi:UDP-glucoronosyl and UDP-glucosyl transferase